MQAKDRIYVDDDWIEDFLFPNSLGFTPHKLLECVSFRKIKIGFLNSKESKNGFGVSLLNRSIQDLLGRARRDPRDLGLICLVKKRKIRSDSFGVLSDLRIQSSIFLKKCTLSFYLSRLCPILCHSI